LTDIEKSLLREPWQLECWDLQQAVTVMLHDAATEVVLSPFGSTRTQACARDAVTTLVVTDAML
jgi:hypothetical protein